MINNFRIFCEENSQVKSYNNNNFDKIFTRLNILSYYYANFMDNN